MSDGGSPGPSASPPSLPEAEGQPTPPSASADGARDIGAIVRGALASMLLPAIAFGLSLVVGAIVIWVSQLVVPGGEFDIFLPVDAYVALFRGAFVGAGPVNTLTFATPLLLAGLGVGLAFRAGLFNIGANGQFLLGALAAVAVGTAVQDLPPPIAIPLAILAGIIAGGVWGFIPGILKAMSGAHEVVTTIMLNFVAIGIVAAVVSGPLDQPGSPSPITDEVGNAALPILIGRNGHLGIVLAVLAAIGVYWLLNRMTLGFEIRAVGANPDAARAAGMRPAFIIVLTMVIAGALAGLAGTVVLLGVTQSMTASFGTSVGFDSIAVALLGRSNPFGIVLAALLFGGMRAGAPLMQISAGIPAELVDVLQAVILLFLVATPYLLRRWKRIGGSVASGETTITKSYGGSGASAS
ncbi:MAG: ABC transporter permease [Chloroflexota bacterium]